jgi:hypothetical protein
MSKFEALDLAFAMAFAIVVTTPQTDYQWFAVWVMCLRYRPKQNLDTDKALCTSLILRRQQTAIDRAIKALSLAARGASEDKFLFKSCSGILFFGTPNRGLNVASLMEMVKLQANAELVRNLYTSSHLLPVLDQDFHEKFKKLKGVKVIPYYEAEETPTVSVYSPNSLSINTLPISG